MLKKDNKGFAFITVIIVLLVVTFVVAAGVAIAMSNYHMKQTRVNSTNNFYDAESGLNAIKGCIQDNCSDVFKEVYNLVTNSMTEIPADQYDTEFNKLYFRKLFEKFEHADLAENTSLLTEYVRKGETEKVVYLDLDDTTNGTYSVSLKSVKLDKTKYDKLVFKGLQVDYTDGTYTDTIVTDIVCEAPNPFGQEGTKNSLIDIYSQYALIADNDIIVENTGEIVKGNIYAGHNIELGKTRSCKLDLYSNLIITRNDILTWPQSRLEIQGYNSGTFNDMYINNLSTVKERTSGSTMVYATRPYTALNFNSNMYLKGDSLFFSKNGNVDLNGNYYGYTIKRNEEDNNPSAMDINGSNIVVDLAGLKTLWLAGNNHIDISSLATTPANDILMGESLTGKFTQSMYLVPSSCIYTEDADGNKITMGNPVDKTKPYVVDLARNELVGGLDLTKYVSGHQDGKKWIGGYREINLQFNTGSKMINRTYLYLDMKDEKSALQYLTEFNIANNDYILNRAKSYNLGNISINDSCVLQTSGNVVTYDGENVSIITNGVLDLYDFMEYRENYFTNIYTSLYSTLTEISSEKNDSLFEYMINVDKIKNHPTKFAISNDTFIANKVVQYNNAEDGSTEVIDIVDPRDGQKYVFLAVDGDVTIKRDFHGVVIATGNINVISNQVNINGTLIAGQDINFGIPYCKIDSQGANIASLVYLLSLYEEHNEYRDFFNQIDRDLEFGDTGRVNLADTIKYDNWTRI